MVDMISIIFLLSIVATQIFVTHETTCMKNYNLGNLYNEIGCKPIYENCSKCPTMYDCTELEHRLDSRPMSCKFKSEVYGLGDDIPMNTTAPCFGQCKCIYDDELKMATIKCAHVECFDINRDPKCRLLYSDKFCCSVNKYCKSNFQNVHTCKVDGRVYVEGERFYPKSDPCKTCLCKPGFKGKFVEPFCKNVTCQIELNYWKHLVNKCTPVYFREQSCCPMEWRCHSSDESLTKIIPPNKKKAKTTNGKCIYAGMEFDQYEELVAAHVSVRCVCLLPPFLTCISDSKLDYY